MPRVSQKPLPLHGGALCLDFVNTVDPRHGLPRDDFLEDYRGLLEWAVHTGAIDATEARALATAAKSRPAAAAHVHRRAVALREALYELLRPGRTTDEPSRAREIVDRELRRALRHAVIEPADGRFRLGWEASADLDRPLWTVVRSAAELLTSAALGRVGECEADGCGWLFLDATETRRRRWCSMAVCGNRAKAQRHRARVRQQGARPGSAERADDRASTPQSS